MNIIKNVTKRDIVEFSQPAQTRVNLDAKLELFNTEDTDREHVVQVKKAIRPEKVVRKESDSPMLALPPAETKPPRPVD